MCRAPYPVLFALLLSVGILSPSAGVAESPETRLSIAVDPRIELTSIIFRLAGHREYNQCRVPSYAADMDAHFTGLDQHEAVQLARLLARTRGLGYDAVPALAVHLQDVHNCAGRLPWDPLPGGLDRRWTPELAGRFAEAACRFAADADFASFWNAHRETYIVAEDRMRNLVQDQGIPAWYGEFFGAPEGLPFFMELALANGPANYGARVYLPGGEELHSIMGVWQADKDGLPMFPQQVLATVVHEFSHSAVNPQVDAHERELEPSGAVLFPLVREAMTSQAYGTWNTVMRESLVRASTLRWVAATWGRPVAATMAEKEQRNSFYWVPELAELLGRYETDRDTYPDLAAFMPRVVEFMDDWAATAEQRVEAITGPWEEEKRALAAKAPKIVSLTPAEGATAVDPGLKEIVVVFDRPMKDRSWSVVRAGGLFPDFTGAAYDEGRTVLRLQVRLKPGQTYRFGLNDSQHMSFMDEQGNRLVPTVVEFSTR